MQPNSSLPHTPDTHPMMRFYLLAFARPYLKSALFQVMLRISSFVLLLTYFSPPVFATPLKVRSFARIAEIPLDSDVKFGALFFRQGELYALDLESQVLMKAGLDQQKMQKIDALKIGNKTAGLGSTRMLKASYDPFRDRLLLQIQNRSLALAQTRSEPGNAKTPHSQNLSLSAEILSLDFTSGTIKQRKALHSSQLIQWASTAKGYLSYVPGHNLEQRDLDFQIIAEQKLPKQLDKALIHSFLLSADGKTVWFSTTTPPALVAYDISFQADGATAGEINESAFRVLKDLFGYRPGMVAYPGSIAVDDQEVLYLADRKLKVIQLFNLEGQFQAVLGDEQGPLFFADLSLMVMDSQSGVLAIYNGKDRRLELWKDLKIEHDLKGVAHQANFQYLRAKNLALGVDNTDRELCQQCHDGHLVGPGPATNSHPVFQESPQFKGAEPDELVDLESKVLNGCLSCHAMHGALSTDGSAIVLKNQCQDCHASTTEKRNHHPTQLQSLTASVALGHKAHATHPEGATQELPECLTCHSVHSPIDDSSLVFKKTNPNSFCHACHFSETSQFQHPLMENPTSATPQPAAEPGIQTKTHTVTCLTCHSIHRFGSDSTKSQAAAVKLQKECVSCHEEQSRTSEPHKLAAHEADPAWPQSLGLLKNHSCLGCHAMHPDKANTALLKSAQDLKLFDPASRLCIGCHGEKATATQRAANRIHPRNLLTNKLPNGVQLLTYDAAGKKITDLDQGGNLGCLSCHVAHGPEKMLKPTEAVIPICLSCHQQNGLPLYKEFHQRLEGENP